MLPKINYLCLPEIFIREFSQKSPKQMSISKRWYIEVKFIIIIAQNFNYNFKIYNYKFSRLSIMLILSYL